MNKRYSNSLIKMLCLHFILMASSSLFPQSLSEKNQGLDTTEISYRYKIGVRYFKEKKYNRAIWQLAKVVKSNDKNWNAFKYKGLAELELENIPLAISDLSQAIVLNPNGTSDTTSIKARAECYRSYGEFTNAIIDYTFAIHLEIRDCELYFGRAYSYYQTGNYYNAINDLNIALGINSCSTSKRDLYMYLGLAEVKLGRIHESIFDFSKCLEIKGDDWQALAFRGGAYDVLFDKEDDKYLDSAVADFKKWVKLNPGQVEAYAALGHVYSEKRDSLRASENFRKAIDLDTSNRYKIYPLWAESKNMFGKYLEARRLFEIAKEKNISFDASDYHEYGMSLAVTGDTIGALKNFDISARMDSSLVNLYRHKFQFSFGVLRYNNTAMEALERLSKLRFNLYKSKKMTARIYAAMSEIKISEGNLTEAQIFLNDAIQLYPEEPILYVLKGYISSFTDGSSRDAVEEFEKALNVRANFKEALAAKAFFYRQQGKIKESCRILKSKGFNLEILPKKVKEYLCGANNAFKFSDIIKICVVPYLKNVVLYPR